MTENITSVSDSSFDMDVLKSDLPVLVDFWAEWCGPCRMLSPVLESVAAKYIGKIKVMKLNVDENTNTPSTYSVRGIPMLILFKQGEAVASKVGALTQQQLIDFIESNISQ